MTEKVLPVIMPSGIPATLLVCEDGQVIAQYTIDDFQVEDTYTMDEIEKLGILYDDPTQLVMEEFEGKEHENEILKVAKTNKELKNRHIANGYLDRMNLGANDNKEVEKFLKQKDVNEKLNDDTEYEFRNTRRNALANPNLYGGRYTQKNINQARKEFLRDKEANKKVKHIEEDLEEDMLTNINDLDFPDALHSAVPTDEEGEVITLEKIVSLLNSLQASVESIKSDIAELKSSPVENEIVEVPDESENAEEDFEDDDSDEDDIDVSYDDTEETDESKNEDLNKTKQEIDNLKRQGKDAKQIKDTIVLMSDDEKEQEQAEKYAVDSLKESLLRSSQTCKLRDLRR